jgi:hypothetical protein
MVYGCVSKQFFGGGVMFQGLPTPIFLPKGFYNIELAEEESLVISLPKKGNFKDTKFGKEIFGEVEFEIFDGEQINFQVLMDVLVCSDLYPELVPGQFFAISHIVMDEEKISIIGREITVEGNKKDE